MLRHKGSLSKVFGGKPLENRRLSMLKRLKNSEGLMKWARPGFLLAFILSFSILSQAEYALSPANASRASGQVALSQPLTLRWQYTTDLTVNLTPATDGARIYLPLAAGTLVSLRALDGQMLWRGGGGGGISPFPFSGAPGGSLSSLTGGGKGGG